VSILLRIFLTASTSYRICSRYYLCGVEEINGPYSMLRRTLLESLNFTVPYQLQVAFYNLYSVEELHGFCVVQVCCRQPLILTVSVLGTICTV
jgi:hypothetical protein